MQQLLVFSSVGPLTIGLLLLWCFSQLSTNLVWCADDPPSLNHSGAPTLPSELKEYIDGKWSENSASIRTYYDLEVFMIVLITSYKQTEIESVSSNIEPERIIKFMDAFDLWPELHRRSNRAVNKFRYVLKTYKEQFQQLDQNETYYEQHRFDESQVKVKSKLAPLYSRMIGAGCKMTGRRDTVFCLYGDVVDRIMQHFAKFVELQAKLDLEENLHSFLKYQMKADMLVTVWARFKLVNSFVKEGDLKPADAFNYVPKQKKKKRSRFGSVMKVLPSVFSSGLFVPGLMK